MNRLVVVFLLFTIARQATAGDAVAMGYNYDGVWTSVTYFRSSTPKNGHHYWNATQACAFAERDLRSRANQDLARTKIIGQSDCTGYVAVARGSVPDANKDITAVGRGKSQNEADENAFRKLHGTYATTNDKIVFRYFSYGNDAGSREPAHRGARRRTKTMNSQT